MEGSIDNIYSPLCVGLYKEEEDYLVLWSVTDLDAKMNCFTWYKENNDWIVPEDQYDEEFKNWRGPIHIMVNYVHRPSRIRKRQRRHARSMQALSSLMAFLEKEIQRYPSSPTSINAVSI